jgi:hypothetical protein
MKKDGAAMEKSSKHEGAKKGPSEYETRAQAVRTQMEKLKALRLARDAANPPPPAPAKRKARSKAPAGKLSDWLSEQAKEGRRS